MLRELQEWLLPAVDGRATDFAFVEWAVAGHHPANSHASPPRNSPDGSGPEITLYLGHSDFRLSLEWLASEFELDQAKPLSGHTLDLV